VIIIRNYKKTFLNPDFCKFWAQFDSFNVSDSCRVIVEYYLARRLQLKVVKPKRGSSS